MKFLIPRRHSYIIAGEKTLVPREAEHILIAGKVFWTAEHAHLRLGFAIPSDTAFQIQLLL
jgi:hypothetical protein